MEEFKFNTAIYVYEMRYDDGLIVYDTDVFVTDNPKKYLDKNDSGEHVSTIFGIQSKNFFVKRNSINNNDVDLVREMKNILLTQYNEYINYLEKNIASEKNDRNNIFKEELRLKKLEEILK